MRLVSVVVGLVRTGGGETQVVGLDGGQLGQLDTQGDQVGSSDFLVQLLGQEVNTDGVSLGLGPEFDLGQDLVGERTGHDERGVTGGTTQVDQSTFGQEDDVPAGLHGVSVDLGLDVGNGSGVGLQPRDIDFNVKVTNVADDSVGLHGLEVLADNDVSTTGGGDEDVGLRRGLVHGGHLVTGHGSLQGVDGVDLGNENSRTVRSQGFGTTLSDITETGDNGDLTGQHDIGGSLDTVDEGLSASVVVVKLGLGDRVVDVDGGDLESALSESLVQVVHTGGGLLGNTLDSGQELGVLFVDQVGQVTSVVEDHVESLAFGEGLQLLLNAPDVLLLGLALPGEDGDTGGGDGGGGVVLGGEDVARGPGDLGTEGSQGLDEDGAGNTRSQTA
jgi:hypothetical protein